MFSLLISVFFFSLVFNFLSPKGETFYTMYDFLKTTFIIFIYLFFQKHREFYVPI